MRLHRQWLFQRGKDVENGGEAFKKVCFDKEDQYNPQSGQSYKEQLLSVECGKIKNGGIGIAQGGGINVYPANKDQKRIEKNSKPIYSSKKASTRHIRLS